MAYLALAAFHCLWIILRFANFEAFLDQHQLGEELLVAVAFLQEDSIVEVEAFHY